MVDKYQFLLPNTDQNIDIISLYKSIEKYNILDLCPKYILTLFNAISGKLDIYEFSNNVENGLKNISEDFLDYKNLIK